MYDHIVIVINSMDLVLMISASLHYGLRLIITGVACSFQQMKQDYMDEAEKVWIQVTSRSNASYIVQKLKALMKKVLYAYVPFNDYSDRYILHKSKRTSSELNSL